jgi:hypothetical protein
VGRAMGIPLTLKVNESKEVEQEMDSVMKTDKHHEIVKKT